MDSIHGVHTAKELQVDFGNLSQLSQTHTQYTLEMQQKLHALTEVPEEELLILDHEWKMLYARQIEMQEYIAECEKIARVKSCY